MIKDQTFDYQKYINYLFVAYALSLPISKAATNLFEISILLLWIFEGNWKIKFALYKNNLLITSLAMLMFIYILSIPWASSTGFAINYIAKFRHFLIILVFYSSFKKEFLKMLFSAFLTGMFISEIISYGIFFEIWHYKNVSPSDPSPFMSHVDYSVYLVFTSILLLSRIIDSSEKNLKLKLAYSLFFLSSTANLFVNGGRTGQVTLIVLVFISIMMSVKHKIKAFTLSLILITSIFMLATTFSPNFKQRANQGIDGIKSMIYANDYKSDGFSQRVSLWIVGIDNFKDHFFLGNGLGNDTKEIRYYAEKRGFDAKFLSQFGDNHNMFLIVGLQVGIIGLLIMLLIFYSIFRLKFNSNIHKILNLTFLVGFFMWSLGNTTFHTMNPMIFFALFAGLFNKLSEIEKDKSINLSL